MGSGTSRGKKVAPARVSEINVAKRDDGDDSYSPKLESHSFRSLKIPKIPNFSRVANARNNNRAQVDCHSEGHDSDCSVEDDDIVVESDRVLAGYDEDLEDSAAKRKHGPKKSCARSKTYGLCHFRRVHVDADFNSTPHTPTTTESCEEPRGPDSGSVNVNKKSNGVFGNFRKHTPPFQNVRLYLHSLHKLYV